MKVKISQSLIKELDKYFDGEKCGHLIYHKYSSGIFEEPSEWMEQGTYFEYIATGALPKDGRIPQPKFLKSEKRLWEKEELELFISSGIFPGKVKTPPLGVDSGSKKSISEIYIDHKKEIEFQSMTSAYQTAYKQAELFKQLCEEMGITILSTQKTEEKNGLVGTLDIEADWEGVGNVTIDLKYSGLINNRWEDMGWSDLYGRNDRGKQYQYHSTQSLQYTYLFDRPFYFWVFSSVNVGETIMMEMQHDSIQIEGHLMRAKESAKKWNILAAHEKAALSAIPEYNECQKCPLFEKCNHKTVIPIPKTVEYE